MAPGPFDRHDQLVCDRRTRLIKISPSPPFAKPRKLPEQIADENPSRFEPEPKLLYMEDAFFALLATLAYRDNQLAAKCLFKHNNTLAFFEAPRELKAFA